VTADPAGPDPRRRAEVEGDEAPAWLDELVLRAEGPPWLSMGIGRTTEADWLQPDHRRGVELAERARLLAERHDEVFAALPGTEAAGAEVLELVRGWERTHRPDLTSDLGVDPSRTDRAGTDRGDDPGAHPLEVAGRRTQEDLVVMVPHDGRYHLDAAVLCFPSHWRLSDKLGGSAAAIHGPVPGYDTELSDRVDRFLDRLAPGVIVARRNWSVHDDPALFAPEPPADPEPATLDQVPDRLWLRSERQTLRRLPATGAVLFTIRVQQTPFRTLARRPDVAAAFAARIAAQPAALTAMNGLAVHRDAALAWLGELAG
jgi:hypothetical protein